MNKISQKVFFLLFTFSPSLTFAATNGFADSNCTGATYTKGLLKGLPCNTPADDLSYIKVLTTNIMSIALSIVGVLFIIMFFVGGFLYITVGIRFGGGRENQIKLAKQMLKFAVIGLVIVLFARLIVAAVATMLGGGVG